MKISIKQIVAIIITLTLALVGFSAIHGVTAHLDAGEIMVIQHVDGNLEWFTTPGYKWQWWGKVTKYKMRDQFWFSAKSDQGRTTNESLRIRFNDGAHATISGSISWEMPMEPAYLTKLHTKYGSMDAVEQQLIRTVIEKCIYMTGPLMSSAESYAARRNDLLNLIADQIDHGVYKTTSHDETIKDTLTGAEKTTKVVELVKAPSGEYAREEESPIITFGLKTYNLSINEITYDPGVETQIQAQQKAIMDIQTAIAKAKTAEQEVLTTEQQGKANAAKAKWEQEVQKATEVTKAEQQYLVAQTNAMMKVEVSRLEAVALMTNAMIAAQQKLDVADLALRAAQKEKEAVIARGEGEAKARELIMEADGALEKKLDAWVKVNGLYAEAIKGYTGNWVPGVVMGGNGNNVGAPGGNAASDLVQLLTLKTAQDLGLSMAISTARPRPASSATAIPVAITEPKN